MPPTNEQIAALRRMVAEPDVTTYTDEMLAALLTETQYTQVVNGDEDSTYDLHAAAALIWSEKAAAVAHLYDASDAGQSLSRNQMHTQAMQMAHYHGARRMWRAVGVARDEPLRRAEELPRDN